jgi:asparagine synthetase B (glutamine-hydrolysing)
MSEVPLGAFLSGGVDSSAVVATMAGLSSEPVNTCSIAFDDPAYDESTFAQMVAERYATRHRAETVQSDDFDLIDTLAGSTTSPTPTARRSPPTASASSRAGTSPSPCRAMAATSRLVATAVTGCT